MMFRTFVLLNSCEETLLSDQLKPFCLTNSGDQLEQLASCSFKSVCMCCTVEHVAIFR